jgi:hypothetical protein
VRHPLKVSRRTSVVGTVVMMPSVCGGRIAYPRLLSPWSRRIQRAIHIRGRLIPARPNPKREKADGNGTGWVGLASSYV